MVETVCRGFVTMESVLESLRRPALPSLERSIVQIIGLETYRSYESETKRKSLPCVCVGGRFHPMRVVVSEDGETALAVPDRSHPELVALRCDFGEVVVDEVLRCFAELDAWNASRIVQRHFAICANLKLVF